MVKGLKRQGKTYYLCPVCGIAYLDREWAEKCQDFCARYSSCSLEITGHAVSLTKTGHSAAGD